MYKNTVLTEILTKGLNLGIFISHNARQFHVKHKKAKIIGFLNLLFLLYVLRLMFFVCISDIYLEIRLWIIDLIKEI